MPTRATLYRDLNQLKDTNPSLLVFQVNELECIDTWKMQWMDKGTYKGTEVLSNAINVDKY